VRGQLLIAGPTLEDPNFWRTVVLVAEHSEAGALGLVLNRPSESTVRGGSAHSCWSLLRPTTTSSWAGPSASPRLIVLADFEEPDEAALLAFDSVGRNLAGGAPTDQLGAGCAAQPGSLPATRAGGPRQLDDEVERAADWILRDPPATAMPLQPEPSDSSGRRCRAAKGGQASVTAAGWRMPQDPTLN